MDALSSVLIAKALDGLALRQSYLAQNIANANTADYSPVQVNFETALREAAGRGAGAVRNVTPSIEIAPGGTGDLRLDMELARSAETSLRYSALADVLSRQMGLARAALVWGN